MFCSFGKLPTGEILLTCLRETETGTERDLFFTGKDKVSGIETIDRGCREEQSAGDLRQRTRGSLKLWRACQLISSKTWRHASCGKL